jgi:long-subunit acyl-CoA synthetase (AMP-forming)
MTFALRTAQAKVLMTAASALPVAIPAAKNAGIPQDRIILLEGKKAGFTTIQDLVALGESFGPSGQAQLFKIPTGQTNKDVCGFLSFSSGTTGLPKAVSRLESVLLSPYLLKCLQVMIAHHNVIAQSMQVEQVTSKENKKVLAVLPLFHSKISLILGI